MSTLNEMLYAQLGGFAGLSSLIGARAYPDVAPLSVAKPYIVWVEISDLPMTDFGGSGGLTFFRVQISAYDVNPSKAKEVMQQVRAAMAAATTFRCVVVEPGERSVGKDPDSKVFGRQCDFGVSFTPS